MRIICPQNLFRKCVTFTDYRLFSSVSNPRRKIYEVPDKFEILGQQFVTDDWTNVTPKIIQLLDRKLHLTPNNPLYLIKERITHYFHQNYRKTRSLSPAFSVHANLSPIVTMQQNFDSLLVPVDHPSRKKSDSYYINKHTLLRAHTSAHQTDLIRNGMDTFLCVGDVYRRDAIDKTHFPAFHQMEGVRLFTKDELFHSSNNPEHLSIFEKRENIETRTESKQETHTLECSLMLESNLKQTLEGLAKSLYGDKIEYKWVSTYFPFTHPSWELEIFLDGDWMETLGCGIVEQKLLQNAGAGFKVGWAFGLGLERLAMILYDIPDIRLFWSNDTGFMSQFHTDDCHKNITYKAISRHPQCINDVSFWLPENGEYSSVDFYDLVRSVGGDLVEQVSLVDKFIHPKTNRTSHCYRVVYRHTDRTLTQEEVNEVHKQLEIQVAEILGGEVR